jgi:hypothetical protein
MILFPVGTLSGGAGTGAIDSINYSFFEPNKKVNSSTTHTTLITQFQNMVMLTRKKAQPYLNIVYEYSSIFHSEFSQIEHFIMSVDDAVTTFYVVDLSKGEVPTAMNTDSSWVASIPNTRLYTATTNLKSNYVFFYNGNIWKLGTISSVSANTSVTCNVDTNNFGTLTDAQALVITGNSRVFIYPVYECYFVANNLDSFKVVQYWTNKDSDRGQMRDGTVAFVSKYKVG